MRVYASLPYIVKAPLPIEKKPSPPVRMSTRWKSISIPVGGSHFAKCSGFVHRSNIVAMSVSKLRLITNTSVFDVCFSRNSARRSHVPFPPAALTNVRLCAAASADSSVMRMSSSVLSPRSVNVAVTRNIGLASADDAP